VQVGLKDPLKFLKKSLRAKPFIVSKSSPVKPGVDDVDNESMSTPSTAPGAIIRAALIWKNHNLYPILKDWCQMTGSIWVINRIDSYTKGKTLVSGPPGYGSLGKLGLKFEAAGKVRVFAMVDCWTQWILSPLHKAIFDLLSQIPQDGTFNQLKPVESLARAKLLEKSRGMYSFDLSAATDRLPIVLQKVLLSPFLTSWGATLWASLLIGRSYYFPGVKSKGLNHQSEDLFYARGQPMGALSSWAMLALTHHAIVQWAAYRAASTNTHKGWFTHYAVLGDDIVIGDREVAKQYLWIMRELGVEISGHKSLVSTKKSVCEFAKKFFVNTKDLSGVPIAEAFVAQRNFSVLLELIRAYDLSLGNVFSLLGYGYRVKGSLSKPLWRLPEKVRNLLLSIYAPGGPRGLEVDRFLRLRSIDSIYPDKSRWSDVILKYFVVSVGAMKERLEALSPLLAEIGSLVTVKRDREHYGTSPWKSDSNPTGREKGTFRTAVLEDGHTVDSIKETVYRETFMDVASRVRELHRLCDGLTETINLAKETRVSEVIAVSPTRQEVFPHEEWGWARRATWAEYTHRVPEEWRDEFPFEEYMFPSGPPDENSLVTLVKAEDIEAPTLDVTLFGELWDRLEEIERTLGELPLPKQLEYRVAAVLRSGILAKVKKWYAYSKPFRSTT